MEDLVFRINQIAIQHFTAHCENGPEQGSMFHTLTSFVVDGETKPLLIAGRTSVHLEDTCYMAILNPDQKAFDRIAAGRFYQRPLKKVLVGHCDAMAHTWMEHDCRYPRMFDAYEAHKPKPVRLTVM